MPTRQAPPQQNAPVQHQAPPPPAVAQQQRQPGMFAQSKTYFELHCLNRCN